MCIIVLSDVELFKFEEITGFASLAPPMNKSKQGTKTSIFEIEIHRLIDA